MRYLPQVLFVVSCCWIATGISGCDVSQPSVRQSVPGVEDSNGFPRLVASDVLNLSREMLRIDRWQRSSLSDEQKSLCLLLAGILLEPPASKKEVLIFKKCTKFERVCRRVISTQKSTEPSAEFKLEGGTEWLGTFLQIFNRTEAITAINSLNLSEVKDRSLDEVTTELTAKLEMIATKSIQNVREEQAILSRADRLTTLPQRTQRWMGLLEEIDVLSSHVARWQTTVDEQQQQARAIEKGLRTYAPEDKKRADALKEADGQLQKADEEQEEVFDGIRQVLEQIDSRSKLRYYRGQADIESADSVWQLWASLAEQALALYAITEGEVEIPWPGCEVETSRLYLKTIPAHKFNDTARAGIHDESMVRLEGDPGEEPVLSRRGTAAVLGLRPAGPTVDILQDRNEKQTIQQSWQADFGIRVHGCRFRIRPDARKTEHPLEVDLTDVTWGTEPERLRSRLHRLGLPVWCTPQEFSVEAEKDSNGTIDPVVRWNVSGLKSLETVVRKVPNDRMQQGKVRLVEFFETPELRSSLFENGMQSLNASVRKLNDSVDSEPVTISQITPLSGFPLQGTVHRARLKVVRITASSNPNIVSSVPGQSIAVQLAFESTVETQCGSIPMCLVTSMGPSGQASLEYITSDPALLTRAARSRLITTLTETGQTQTKAGEPEMHGSVGLAEATSKLTAFHVAQGNAVARLTSTLMETLIRPETGKELNTSERAILKARLEHRLSQTFATLDESQLETLELKPWSNHIRQAVSDELSVSLREEKARETADQWLANISKTLRERMQPVNEQYQKLCFPIAQQLVSEIGRELQAAINQGLPEKITPKLSESAARILSDALQSLTFDDVDVSGVRSKTPYALTTTQRAVLLQAIGEVLRDAVDLPAEAVEMTQVNQTKTEVFRILYQRLLTDNWSQTAVVSNFEKLLSQSVAGLQADYQELVSKNLALDDFPWSITATDEKLPLELAELLTQALAPALSRHHWPPISQRDLVAARKQTAAWIVESCQSGRVELVSSVIDQVDQSVESILSRVAASTEDLKVRVKSVAEAVQGYRDIINEIDADLNEFATRAGIDSLRAVPRISFNSRTRAVDIDVQLSARFGFPVPSSIEIIPRRLYPSLKLNEQIIDVERIRELQSVVASANQLWSGVRDDVDRQLEKFRQDLWSTVSENAPNLKTRMKDLHSALTPRLILEAVETGLPSLRISIPEISEFEVTLDPTIKIEAADTLKSIKEQFESLHKDWKTRHESELARLRSAWKKDKDRITGEFRKYVDQATTHLENGLDDLLKQLPGEFLGQKCEWSLSANTGGGTRTLDLKVTGTDPVPSFEVQRLFVLDLSQSIPRARFNPRLSAEIPELQKPLERILQQFLPDVQIINQPILADGQLTVDIHYRPSGFPFGVDTRIELSPEDGISLHGPEFRTILRTAVESAFRKGVKLLEEELRDDSGKLGIGPVTVTCVRAPGGSCSESGDEQGQFITDDFDVIMLLDAELQLTDGFGLPFSVRLHSRDGLSVQFDDSLIASAVGRAVNELLGDSLPLGLKLDEPAFTLDGGLKVFVLFKVDIPVLGAGLGGRLIVSGEGVDFGDALRIRIPAWFDAPPVSFGNLEAIVDLRNKAIGLGAALAVSPGQATNHLFRVQGRGTISLVDWTVTLEGEVYLVTVLKLGESHVILKPSTGTFEVNSRFGLANLIRLDGQLFIEARTPRRVGNRDANIHAISAFSVLGQNLQKIEAGMNWQLELWARSEIDVALGHVLAELSFDEKLKNPQLSFKAKVDGAAPVAEIHCQVMASETYVLVRAETQVFGIPMGFVFDFAGLNDVTPERILARILSIVKDFNPSLPAGLTFAPGMDKDGDGVETEDNPTTSRPSQEPAEPKPELAPIENSPPQLTNWNRGWRYDPETYEDCDGGVFGLFKDCETKTRWVPKTLDPLIPVYGTHGKPTADAGAFFRETSDSVETNFLTVIHKDGLLRAFRSGESRPCWMGRSEAFSGSPESQTTHAFALLSVVGRIAIFAGYHADQCVVFAVQSEQHLAVNPTSVSDFENVMYNLSQRRIEGTTLQEMGVSGLEKLRSQLEQIELLAWMAFQHYDVKDIRRIDDGVHHLTVQQASGLGELIHVKARGTHGNWLLEDLSAHGSAMPGQNREDHWKSLKRIAPQLTSMKLDTNSGLDVRGRLVTGHQSKWSHALVCIGSESEASGPLYLMTEGATSPKGRWQMTGSKDSSLGPVIAGLNRTWIKPRQSLFELLSNDADVTRLLKLQLNVDEKRARIGVLYGMRGQSEVVLAAVDTLYEADGVSAELKSRTWSELTDFWKKRRFLLPAREGESDQINTPVEFLSVISRGQWRKNGWKANPYGAFFKSMPTGALNSAP